MTPQDRKGEKGGKKKGEEKRGMEGSIVRNLSDHHKK